MNHLRDREIGRNRREISKLGGSRDLIQRLRFERELEGHEGCVNTVSFTPDGATLISGSDDRDIICWDWQQGKTGIQKLRYPSGHSGNVFQAKALHEQPNTIITSAADGLVRVGHVRQGASARSVETSTLYRFNERAHRLSLDPFSPTCFLACGEDGQVVHFDLRESEAGGRLLMTVRAPEDLARESAGGRRRDSYISLYSVDHDPLHQHQFGVAGDDPRIFVYDQRTLTSARPSSGAEEGMGGGGAGPSAGPEGERRAMRRLFRGESPTSPLGHRAQRNIDEEDEDEDEEGLTEDDVRRGRQDASGSGRGGDSTPPALQSREASVGRSGGRQSGGGGATNAGRCFDPVRVLCPTAMLRSTAAPKPHITCIKYSKKGELLATYNDDHLYLFAPEGFPRPTHAPSPTRGGGFNPEHPRLKRLRENFQEGGAEAGPEVDDEEEAMETSQRERERAQDRAAPPAVTSPAAADEMQTPEEPWDHVLRTYAGHRNLRTVKGCNYLGPDDSYVVSGSDCGHVFIYCKSTGELVQMLNGDDDIVNCVEPHPLLPCVLATSGIENTIKIWEPRADLPTFNARLADQQVRRNQSHSVAEIDELRRRRALLARLLQSLSGTEIDMARNDDRGDSADEEQEEEEVEGAAGEESEGRARDRRFADRAAQECSIM